MSGDDRPDGRRRRLAVVTGATGGIGRETASGLLRRGLDVCLVGRDVHRGPLAAAELTAASEGGTATFEVADLSSQKEVLTLAGRLREQHRRIDVLVNNVGAVVTPRRETVDGVESTLAINVLNPLLLTLALLPALEGPAPGRVVLVNSGAIRIGRVHLDDLQAVRRPYYGMSAYYDSKLLSLLALVHLRTIVPGHRATFQVADPGTADTTMARSALVAAAMPPWLRLTLPLARRLQRGKTTANAARSSIVAATDPRLASGPIRWVTPEGDATDLPRAARRARRASEVFTALQPLLPPGQLDAVSTRPTRDEDA